MNKSQAIKNIAKTNSLRAKIKKLRQTVWTTSISSEYFKLTQKKLKAAEKELSDGHLEHKAALRVWLSP